MLGLSNSLVLTPDESPRNIPDFYTVSGGSANHPYASHALWFYSQMVRWRQVEFSEDLVAAARATYRPDIYCDALGLKRSDLSTMRAESTGFFDDILFDPWDLKSYLGQLGVRC